MKPQGDMVNSLFMDIGSVTDNRRHDDHMKRLIQRSNDVPQSLPRTGKPEIYHAVDKSLFSADQGDHRMHTHRANSR